MSRAAERSRGVLLGAIAFVALVYLALPVQAGVGSTSNEGVLCAKSTRTGVVLANCSERGWLAGLVDSDLFFGVQMKFQDPIF